MRLRERAPLAASVLVCLLFLASAALRLPILTPGPGYAQAPSSVSGEWTSIGPERIQYVDPPLPQYATSGSVDAIGYSPSDPNTIFTGGGPFSPGGYGAWKSLDGGQTWASVPQLENLSVSAFLISPTDSSTVLADGFLNFYIRGGRTGEMMKSTDGGQTWNVSYGHGGDVLYDAPNSTVYATTLDGVIKSNDFGSTWQNVTAQGVIDPNSTVDAAAFSDNGQIIYLGVVYVEGGAALLVSKDGGRSFSVSESVPDANIFNTVAVDPSNPDDVWISCFVSYTTSEGLYHSTDGGESWQAVASPVNESPQFLAIDPKGTGVMLVGYDPFVYKFVNGVPSRVPLLDIGDVRNIIFDPSNDQTILLGTDQGLFITHDGGASWGGLNNRPNNLIYSMAASGRRIILQTQDYNVPVVSCDGGATWALGAASGDAGVGPSNGCVSFGNNPTFEGGWIMADPYNSSSIFLEELGYTGYGLNGGSSFLVSHDGGANFDPTSGLPSALNNALPPFAFTGGSTAYAIGEGIYKTADGGKSWSLLENSPSNVSSVSASIGTPGLVYALAQHGLYVSHDSGSSWALMNDFQNATVSYLATVAVDPVNSSLVVAQTENCLCLMRSTDGGATMTSESIHGPGSIGHIFVFASLGLSSYLLPSGRVALFLLSSGTVFVSFDFGLTWSNIGQGLPPNSYTSLSLSADGNGYLSTYGYGAWEWPNMTSALEAAPLKGPISPRTPSSSTVNYKLSIPEFPVQWLVASVFVIFVAVSYALVRRRGLALQQPDSKPDDEGDRRVGEVPRHAVRVSRQGAP